MFLTSASIHRPVTVTVIFIAVSLLGIFAFTNLGVNLLPNVNLPHLIVQTSFQNAMPEEVEKQITEPLESAVGTVTGVKKVTSVSKEGVSVISVDFVWGTDMKYALLSLREKLDNMSFALPKEAGRPTIIRSDPSSSPIMTLVLSYKNESLLTGLKTVDVRGEKKEARSEKFSDESNNSLLTLHPSSINPHPSSIIKYPASNIQYPVSSI